MLLSEERARQVKTVTKEVSQSGPTKPLEDRRKVAGFARELRRIERDVRTFKIDAYDAQSAIAHRGAPSGSHLRRFDGENGALFESADDLEVGGGLEPSFEFFTPTG